MKVNTISNLSMGNSTIPVFLPKTPRRDCIDIVSDINSDIIKQLDSFGLINRATLNQYLSYAEKEKQLSCKRSLETICDIVYNPQIQVEQKDSGYFYSTQSPYDYRKNVEGYAKGESYKTLKLEQEYQFKRNLRNLAYNGTLEDAMELVKLLPACKSSAIKLDASILANNNNAKVCKYEKPNSYGILSDQSPENFIKNALTYPIIKTVKAIRNNLSTTQQAILNDFIFDEGNFLLLSTQSDGNILID